MKRIQGVYTALVTPFKAEGQLDEEGLRENIRFQIASGVDGIVPLGSTGEAPTLTFSEKERVIRIASEEAKGKVLVMVGTGSYSTQQTIENTHLAEELGADMALVVSPYYNKPTQEGLYRHFYALADTTPLPIIVYNVQGRTGQNIGIDTLKRLADIPKIAGVKEASGNVSQIGEVIEIIARHRPDFSVLSGDDNLTLPLMAMGGHGIISVVSNLIPKEIKKLVEAMASGDYALAREIHYQWMPLFRGAFIETNPIPIKTAMNMCGHASGGCRLPLCDLLPENEQKLRTILQGCGVNSVQSFLIPERGIGM
jgi:4-hydroxy-tetrahydrodipicolinate synthase